MLSKIIKFAVPIIMLCLIIGIVLQYYISMKLEPQTLVCHKGKLLAKIDNEEAVYTRMKKLSCDYEKGMLIIEEQL